MPKSDLLRPSRDGDQFHYYWAARRSLQLLAPGTDLEELVVEGSYETSVDDTSERVIDLSEYYSDTTSPRVVYRQLKHTTLKTQTPWTASFLRTTLIGFAERYSRLLMAADPLADHCQFVFVTNRPAADTVTSALASLRAGARGNQAAKDMRRLVADVLNDEHAEQFFGRFKIDDDAPGLLELTSLFRTDVGSLLPGARGNEDLLLKEMIGRRATSLLGSSPGVTRETVLAALGASVDQLMPAPNKIQRAAVLIETSQTSHVVQAVIDAHEPILIHAAGGIGKTVLAQSLAERLPAGSVTLVYDCFANGNYRHASEARHEHAQAYVQISNELASHGYCRPLVPSGTATPEDYAKALMDRLSEASRALAATGDDRLLTVVIDAADNAVMVANDVPGGRAFVGDLIREVPPANVRLVFLCRTERRALLDPPPTSLQIELEAFGLDETRAHIAMRWNHVSAKDVAEFHQRTGGNPRVQSFVMAGSADVDAALRSLGEARSADRSVLDRLLQKRVDKIRDDHHGAAEVDRLCRALATLRPRIPIRVLATLAGCDAGMIRSFANDLITPLLIDGDTVQFRDEPSETWFRNRFRPSGSELNAFIETIEPLASADGYAAAALPQLLFEAGRTDDLVSLALSERSLPDGSELERLEIAQQRARFALRAVLRDLRLVDVARLAVRAGHLAAGHGRRKKIIIESPDLAARFLDAQVIDDLVAARGLTGSWPGSHLHHDGALLSCAPGQADNARSRLRSATEWMTAYVRHAHELSENHDVEDNDVAALAWGLLNTDGPEASAEFLSRWTPPEIAFRCGSTVADRLLDAGRTADLESLLTARQAPKHLKLAAAAAAFRANVSLSPAASRHIATVLTRHRKPITLEGHGGASQDRLLQAVIWTVVMGLRHRNLRREQALRVLSLYLPSTLGHAAGASHSRRTRDLLLGHALRALLTEEPLRAEHLAVPTLRQELERPHSTSGEASEFRANVLPLARIAQLWAWKATGAVGDGSPTETFQAALSGSHGYPTPQLLINSAAQIAARMLDPSDDQELLDWTGRWLDVNGAGLWRSTLTDITRITARNPHAHAIALRAASAARQELAGAKEDAESRCDDLIALARASLPFSEEEARTHFDHAVEIADKVGEDVYARWRTLLSVAGRTSQAGADQTRCLRLAQVAESLEPYLGDAFNPHHAMTALAELHENHAYGIASRWRDRRVADLSQTTGPLIRRTARRPGTAKATFALLALGAHEAIADLLIAALREDPATADATLRVLGAASRERRFSVDDLDRLSSEADRLGLDLAGAGLEAAPVAVSHAESIDVRPAASDQAAATGELDLTSPEGWAAALLGARHFRTQQATLSDIMDTVRAAPPRKLEEMTSAFADCPAVDLHHVNVYLQTVSDVSPRPASLANLCHKLAITAISRQASDLLTKTYRPVDLDLLASVTGRPAQEYRGIGLQAMASTAWQVGAEGCFELVAALMPDMPAADAGLVFDDLCDLFASVAPAVSVDDALDPNSLADAGSADAVAGLVWAALADPQAATRWRAAHTVRLLAELGCTAELQAVVAFANGDKDPAPFVDSRLAFYEWHARQWLQLALHRAAAGDATDETLHITEPWLRRACFDEIPHAVIRPLAADILIRLDDAALTELTADERTALGRAGEPTSVQVRERDYQLRGWRPRDDSTQFAFFFDFEEHWAAPLAEAFGVPPETVVAHADLAISRAWPDEDSLRSADDLRRSRSLYRADTTHVYKSSRPEEDDLRFYIAVHGLHIAAAEMLASRPVVRHADEDRDAYRIWLSGHVPTREDGRWLSDLRDPPPWPQLDIATERRRDGRPDEAWLYDVRLSDLDEAARPAANLVTIWAQEEDRSYSRSTTVAVRSALVPTRLAPALMHAMQTADSSRDYSFPPSHYDDVGEAPAAYQIDAWVDDDCWPDGLDIMDPLARGTRWPPPRFNPAHAGALGLTPDRDSRIWRTADGSAVARCRTWDTADSRDSVGQSGRRLTMSRDHLATALGALGRSLLLEVEITRHMDDRAGSRRDAHDRFPYLTPYFRIIVIDP